MNDSQKMQKVAARSLSMKCTEGLDGSFAMPGMSKANEHGDSSMDRDVSPSDRKQAMRSEMGEKI